MISRRLLLAGAAMAPATGALAAAARSSLPQVITGNIMYEQGKRLWTPVLIDGHGPYRFAIATGAEVSGIREALGSSLGLKFIEQVNVGGVSGDRDVNVFAARNVIIGGAFRQKEAAFLGLRANGPDDGLLAAGVLTSFDSEIDVLAGQFRIFPQGQTNRDGYVRLPGSWTNPDIQLNVSRRLWVDVVIDGYKARLIVDTGAGAELFLTSSYMRRTRALWDSKTRYALASARGSTGDLATREARCALAVGKVSMGDEVVTFGDPAIRDTLSYDGVLGMGLLERYIFAFESARPALWLKPNGFIPGPRAHNRSGLEPTVVNGVGKVWRVQPGGPAARAGIAEGDLLPGIADEGARSRFGDQIRGAAGSVVTFDIIQGGKRRTVSLTLEDML